MKACLAALTALLLVAGTGHAAQPSDSAKPRILDYSLIGSTADWLADDDLSVALGFDLGLTYRWGTRNLLRGDLLLVAGTFERDSSRGVEIGAAFYELNFRHTFGAPGTAPALTLGVFTDPIGLEHHSPVRPQFATNARLTNRRPWNLTGLLVSVPLGFGFRTEAFGSTGMGHHFWDGATSERYLLGGRLALDHAADLRGGVSGFVSRSWDGSPSASREWLWDADLVYTLAPWWQLGAEYSAGRDDFRLPGYQNFEDWSGVLAYSRITATRFLTVGARYDQMKNDWTEVVRELEGRPYVRGHFPGVTYDAATLSVEIAPLQRLRLIADVQQRYEGGSPSDERAVLLAVWTF